MTTSPERTIDREDRALIWPGLKPLLRVIALVLVSPLLAGYLLAAAGLRGRRDVVLQSFSQTLSLVPGLFGDYLRSAFYRATLRACHEDVRICFGTIITTPEVEIHRGVYIGPHGNIGHCVLGADTLLGSNVTILGGKTQHDVARLDVPIRHQGGAYTIVQVGRDVWIGNGAIVAADVGDQAVVGAGAVVMQPVPPRTVVAGNPARTVRTRA